MEAASSSETSETIYESKRHHTLQDLKLLQRRQKNLKSRSHYIGFWDVTPCSLF